MKPRFHPVRGMTYEPGDEVLVRVCTDEASPFSTVYSGIIIELYPPEIYGVWVVEGDSTSTDDDNVISVNACWIHRPLTIEESP